MELLYYRSVSFFLFQTEEQYNLIRMVISTYTLKNRKEISDFQPTIELINRAFIETSTYIRNMSLNKNWAGDIEMQLTSYIFNINIKYLEIII